MSRPVKEAKTYQEQVDNLINNHGLIISDRNRAIMILSNVSYYRLSAYGIGLKQADNHELYVPGITLDHIYHLYQFDSKLRNILLPLIEAVEISFRTKLAYQLAVTYGAEGYTNAENFKDKTDRNGVSLHQNMMEKLAAEIRHQDNLPLVKHHNTQYDGHFPIWAASELFSFGMICSLYSICKNTDRKSVSKEYHANPQRLYGWMLALLELRNMCAHYNRIYNMLFKQMPALEAQYASVNGNRLFPRLVVLKGLVDNDMWHAFLENLKVLLKEYPEVNLGFMGFPSDWEEIL